MGLFQLGCFAWIHLVLALTVTGLNRTELFDYGVQHGDQILEPGPDQNQELALDQTLFFYKSSFDTVYISTNGFIAMDSIPDEAEYLGKMPASFGMVAALMGDLDTSDGVGKVYYRQDSSPAMLLRATEHISQAFPADDEVEPTHVIIVTWENVWPQGLSGRGDGVPTSEGNTFQLVVASMESASYAILLYPGDGLHYLSTPIGGKIKPLEVGFNQGEVSGWLWSSAGEYYRVSSDDVRSIRQLTRKTNSGQRGVWVYEIGTSPFFTSIHSGETDELDFEDFEESTPAPTTTVPVPVIPEREREWEGDYEEGPDYPPVHPPYETVTEDWEEETPDPPTQAPQVPVDPGQFPVYRRPTYPEPSYPEPPRFPEPVQPEPRRPSQPERPQVVVVDTDDLDVDVFSYNYETCANNWQKCSSFADCRDYSSGYCCHCRPGYYGDGRDCVAEGKPQRMNGKVTGRVFVGGSSSPLEFASNELHSYVVANDGRAYVAISTIPASLGPSLQPLASLGGAIGWAFALEQPGYQNGFSLIGGRFTRQAEVTFHPGGERLSITQVFKGIDEHDHLTISTTLEGRIPEVPRAATVQIEPYKEIYQYSRNIITSSSRRDYTVTLGGLGVQTLSYSWRQTITFEGCHHDQGANQPPSSQQLSVDQVFVMYDSANQLIRYAMSNKIGSIHSEGVENPCFTGRHGCDTNAMCRPGEGTHFTCECATGFTGDGRACYDVDECRQTPQICGRHAVCSNQPGTFRCECMDGFQFSSDGRTCVEVERPVNHCVRGTHDCDLAERAQCSYTGGSAYLCSCLPGYQGDGRTCRDINECQPGRCHGDAICYNTQGSFTCQCRPGFYGDGFHCTPDSHREKTACEQHRERALAASANTGGYFFFRPRPAVGQFVPTCDPYGAYEPMQCHGSTGQCWCVDREGQEITGTRTGPDSKPSCIDQGVAPTPVGPTPRPDVSPLAPGTSLLFAQSGKIEHLPLNGETMLKDDAKTLLHVPDKVVIALAYDCVDKVVYWSDITQPAISSVPLKGGQPTTLIKTDLGSPEGIAIDHLSRLMFWTDSMMDRIEVSKLDGSHRRVLFDDNLVNPRPIVADPLNGRLYWSDWNRDGPKVEMSNMDGTDRSVLVSEDLGLPNGLTFDPQTRQLCWADAGTRKVECVDPYTRQRRKIVEGIQYPFAVVHYGSNLYYTDWRREAVVSVDRRAEKEVDEYLPLRRSRTYGITTTHPQCLPGVNYCSGSNGGCSHLCLPRPGGLTCRCPDANDGTCVERDRQ